MTERKVRKEQENDLYENYFAQEMLNSGRTEQYKKYLAIMNEKCKNGMSPDEIEAVKQRAETAAKAFQNM